MAGAAAQDAAPSVTYIFDHIYKTGGTTLHSGYLSTAVERQAARIIPGLLLDNARELRRLIELAPAEKSKLKMIAGHHAGWIRGAFPKAQFVTLVRDPIQRAVSAYLHWCGDPGVRSLLHRFFDPDHTSLLQFVQGDLAAQAVREYALDQHLALPGFLESEAFAKAYASFVSMRNRQTAVVLGNECQHPVPMATMHDALRERFAMVATTERLEELVFHLHLVAGLPLLLFNNHLVRPEHRTFSLSTAERDAIHACNSDDLALHAAVNAEFDRLQRDAWDSASWSSFLCYRAALEQFRLATDGDISRVMHYELPVTIARVAR